MLGIVIPVLGVTLAFTQTRFLTWIKSRTTFPRTGYAEPKHMDRPHWIAAGLMALLIVALIFAGGLARWGGWEDAHTVLTALALSGGFVVIGAWQGVRRISYLGVWGLAAALALTRAGFTGDRLTGVHALALGAAALLSGGITLALFLKRTRPAGEG